MLCRVQVPLQPWVPPTEVYRFSPEEWANLLAYYDAVVRIRPFLLLVITLTLLYCLLDQVQRVLLGITFWCLLLKSPLLKGIVGVLQGLCAQDHVELIKSFMLTQGNPKELRVMREALSFLPSTAMYKDRR